MSVCRGESVGYVCGVRVSHLAQERRRKAKEEEERRKEEEERAKSTSVCVSVCVCRFACVRAGLPVQCSVC